MVKPKRARRQSTPVSKSDHTYVSCELCGKELLRSEAIRHHVDPFRKTKEPGALTKADRREKNDLIYVCRACHGRIHKKLQPKRVRYVDENGKVRWKKPYATQNTEASIWRQ